MPTNSLKENSFKVIFYLSQVELNTLQHINAILCYKSSGECGGRLKQLQIIHPGKKKPYGNLRNIAFRNVIPSAFNVYLFHQLLHDRAESSFSIQLLNQLKKKKKRQFPLPSIEKDEQNLHFSYRHLFVYSNIINRIRNIFLIWSSLRPSSF